MDFGVHFDTIFSDVRELIHYSKLAEQYGLKVWVADESYRRETFTVMAAIAAQTKLHSLGCNVTHPYGRSPIILGAVAATVARLMEEGEFVFGLGSGGGTLRLHIPIKITSAAIELLQVIRRMFDGEALTFDDYPILSEMYRLRPGIPIFPLDPVTNARIIVGSTGSRLLDAARKYADGFVMPNLCSIGNARAVKKGWLRTRGWEIVENARKAAGRSKRAFKRIYALHISVSKDGQAARQRARTNVGFGITARAREQDLAELFSPDELRPIDEARQVFYSGRGWEAITEAIPLDLVDNSGYLVAGAPKECIDQAAEIVAHKDFEYFDEIIFGSPLGPNIPEAIELLSKEVAPAISAIAKK